MSQLLNILISHLFPFFRCGGRCHYLVDIFLTYGVAFFPDCDREDNLCYRLGVLYVWILVLKTTCPRVSANLKPGLKGSLYPVCCFRSRWWTLSNIYSNISVGMLRHFGMFFGSYLLSLTMSWSYMPNCRRLSGCSYGLLQIRRILVHLLHLNWPLINSWILIFVQTPHRQAVGATYCSIITVYLSFSLVKDN